MKNNFEEVKEILKKEFFGINDQIDQVVKSFETWMTIKEYQERPMIVCLWGLTGTGKTALINRCIELFDLGKKKFYIKFGTKTSRIDDDFEQNECKDTVFVLDEFQYFKTRKESGEEIERDEDNSTNIIWELLDGGKVNLYGQSVNYGYEKYQLISSLYSLKYLNSCGAKLENGVIYHEDLVRFLKNLHISLDLQKNVDLEKKETETYYYDSPIEECEDLCSEKSGTSKQEKPRESKTEIRLKSVMSVNLSGLYDFMIYRDIDYTFHSKPEFYSFIKKFNNLDDLIKFLKSILDAKPKLEIRDYSQSLIFLLGNLDECFTMSNNLNSDLDADFFYKKTKSISIIEIRQALTRRFRPEQIARLGSTHIIYPSLNKEAFNKIIEKELDKFTKTVKTKFTDDTFKINNVVYTDSIKELIYKEGVFPVIGARSVFSIVNEIINDKLSLIIKSVLNVKNTEVNSISISFNYKKSSSTIEINYINDDTQEIVDNNIIKYIIKVDKLRNEKNKGKQAHRAVHEAGHAVCSIILENVFPECIYSVVLENKNSGFNLFNSEDFYFERKNTMLNSIASLLAGYLAESMIFGPDNVSNGSGSDISKATSKISSLLKDCGFSKNHILGKYVSNNFTSTDFISSNYDITIDSDEFNNEVTEILKEAQEIASNTLEKQKILFLKISEYLNKYPKLTNKKLKELTKKYIVGIEYSELLKDKESFYLESLNNELKIFSND